MHRYLVHVIASEVHHLYKHRSTILVETPVDLTTKVSRRTHSKRIIQSDLFSIWILVRKDEVLCAGEEYLQHRLSSCHTHSNSSYVIIEPVVDVIGVLESTKLVNTISHLLSFY